MNRSQNKKKMNLGVQDEKKNSEREVFNEFESIVKGMVRILFRISLRNIC